MKEKEKKPFKERLLNKYRLVVLNEDTYEEKLSYKLTKLNIFLLIALVSATLVVLTIGLIAFTSVKEYIPGYDSTVLRQNAIKNIELLDSLERVVNKNQTFINSVGSGETNKEEISQERITKKIDVSELDFKINKQDSLLRNLVEKEDRFNTIESASPNVEYILYSPLSGKISSGFDITEKHFGVDIPAVTNTPVKAVSDGKVILSEWTIETGFVIVLEHSFNLISVYKHNSSGLISQGDFVKSGQAIALSGNTGEFTTGPHLHFELWSNGNPVDPLEYISFE